MIAALCAFDAGNPGMATSNLALAQLLGSRANDTAFVNLQRTVDRFDGMVRYRCGATRQDLERAELVIGWGDFIHAIGWARIDLMRDAAAYGLNPERIIADWLDLYMLRDAEPRRSISSGSTAYTVSYEELLEPEYGAAFGDLARKLDHLDFRDPLSVSIVRSVTGIDAALGCDCALLLDAQVLQQQVPTTLPDELRSGPYLLSCFARSGLTSEQVKFADAVARILGLRHFWFTWFGSDPDDLELFAGKLTMIRNATYCISDIYHLCVNALREGVPTLCMSPPGRAESSVDDEKKRVFFLSHGLRRHLFDSSGLAPPCSGPMMKFLAEQAAEDLRSDAYRAFLAGPFLTYVARCREYIREHIG